MQWIAREMDVTLKLTVLLSAILNCNGVSIQEQLAHIAQIQQENEDNLNNGRRFSIHEESVVLGAPSYPSHLPEAEPILPGHTLIRPSLGMLKSSVKFPHKDFENGAGVYGNIDNLGLRYDSRNERLMYSGFRRTPTDLIVVVPEPDLSFEDETSNLRVSKKDKDQQRNTIKKFVKIFPVKPMNQKPYDRPPPPWAKLQPLILMQPSDDSPRNRNKRQRSVKTEFDTTDEEQNDLPNLPSSIRHRTDGVKYDIKVSNPNIKRTLESRLISSAKTLLFTKKLLEKLQANRQRRQQDVIVIKARPESYSGGGIDKSIEDTDPSLVPDKPKKKLLFYGQDAYNHIKINANAPEHVDYLPADLTEGDTDAKKWWYYHQADFIPFDGRNDERRTNEGL